MAILFGMSNLFPLILSFWCLRKIRNQETGLLALATRKQWTDFAGPNRPFLDCFVFGVRVGLTFVVAGQVIG
jgi:hypothetical protein